MNGEFGMRLQRARKAAGLSARQLSEALGGALSRGVIANIESDRKQVTLDEAVILAAALNVPPAALDDRLSTPDDQWRAGYQQAINDLQARFKQFSEEAS